MAQHHRSHQSPATLLSLAGIAAGLAWWAYHLNPPMIGNRIDWFSALIHLLAGLFCLQTVIRSLDIATHFIDFFASRTPRASMAPPHGPRSGNSKEH
jgi:type IV secretion system protein VirD4